MMIVVATTTIDDNLMKMAVPEEEIMMIGVLEEAGVVGAEVVRGGDGRTKGSPNGIILIEEMETRVLMEIVRDIKDDSEKIDRIEEIK